MRTTYQVRFYLLAVCAGAFALISSVNALTIIVGFANPNGLAASLSEFRFCGGLLNLGFIPALVAYWCENSIPVATTWVEIEEDSEEATCLELLVVIVVGSFLAVLGLALLACLFVGLWQIHLVYFTGQLTGEYTSRARDVAVAVGISEVALISAVGQIVLCVSRMIEHMGKHRELVASKKRAPAQVAVAEV